MLSWSMHLDARRQRPAELECICSRAGLGKTANHTILLARLFIKGKVC